MKSLLVCALAFIGSLTIGGASFLTCMNADSAEAAETATKKKKKVQPTAKKPQTKKNNYCGYPAPPNPAGMSDYCSYMYNIYCRRGVGCSIYGREY